MEHSSVNFVICFDVVVFVADHDNDMPPIIRKFGRKFPIIPIIPIMILVVFPICHPHHLSHHNAHHHSPSTSFPSGVHVAVRLHTALLHFFHCATDRQVDGMVMATVLTTVDYRAM